MLVCNHLKSHESILLLSNCDLFVLGCCVKGWLSVVLKRAVLFDRTGRKL